MAFLTILVEHIGNRGFISRVEEIGRAFAFLTHAHVERAVSREGKAPLALIELHRGYADIHHYGINLRNADARHLLAHRGEALGVERQAPLEFGHHTLPVADRIGIAVESIDTRTSFKQRARIAAGTEGCVDDRHLGLRVDGRDDFF